MQKGYSWYTTNKKVNGNGIVLSVEKQPTQSVDSAYFGKLDFGNEDFGFNISFKTNIYPYNYMTFKFSALEDNDDFGLYIESKMLQQEAFYNYFSTRRDLLLGEYSYDEDGVVEYDPESVFEYVEYNGTEYAETLNDLPARPAISLSGSTTAAFNSANNRYLTNSTPYLVDLLYNFETQNKLIDSFSFVLYTSIGGAITQYLLLVDEDKSDDKGVFLTPKYSRTSDDEEWDVFNGSLKLDANFGDDSIIYALVLGYGVETYKVVGNKLEMNEAPKLKVEIKEGTTLNYTVPSNCSDVSPYEGTFYSKNYNCFIGSALSIKLMDGSK